MIVVTGAGGQLGRAVIDGLLDRLPTGRIVASVRDPGNVASLSERSVEVRAGGFARHEGLATAFAGAGQVLVVSFDQLGEPARRLHRTAIEAARMAGARRVLYTSHMGAGPARLSSRRPTISPPRRSWPRRVRRSRHCATASTLKVRCTSRATVSRPARSVRRRMAR